ncbi:MAG: hypothetical protein GY805_00555 [Chloroflexi bacterium]|nr:hypothetical protein [Chloroflexota bacterium]
MVYSMEQVDPTLIGNEYLIVGTVERKGWRESRKQPGNYDVIFDNMHDFKEVVVFELAHWEWVLDD